jgi:hypothetical protein
MAMSTTNQMPTEREDIEMLLPWYVTGKLVAPDRARVEAWLKRDPDLARQVDLIRAEQSETQRSSEALRAPASLTVERTMAMLQGSGGASAVTGLLGRIRDFFVMPSAGPVRWAAAAAGAIMLVQAGAVGYLVSERQGPSYGTASGGPSGGQNATPPGTYALVRFSDSATAATIAASLADLGMSIVDGPRQGGLFRVRIGAADMSEKDRDGRIEALRGRPGFVVLATPSPSE